MKAYLAVIKVLNYLFVLSASVLAILWWGGALRVGGAVVAAPYGGVALPHGLRNIQTAAFVVGIVMLALNAIAVLVRIRGTTRPQYLIFEKEGAGSLKIALDAIEETLDKCATTVPEVNDARVKVVLEKGGKMPRRAVAHCVFADVPNLFAVQESLRQLLTGRYQEIFPGEELLFEIVVDRLRPEHERGRRKRSDEDTELGREEAGDKPFGPRYPIER